MAQRSLLTPYPDLNPDIRYNKSTALVDGGELSINGTNQFDVAAGNGEIVDNHTDPNNPTFVRISWDASTANSVTNLATKPVTFVGVNSSGTIVQQFTAFTEAQSRSIIILGTLVHPDNTNIDAVATVPNYAASTYSALRDLAVAVGTLNLSGNVYSESGANLSIDKTAGKTFSIGSNYETSKANPNVTIDAVDTALTFSRAYQDGAGDTTFVSGQTTIDPANYDDGDGTLGSMTASYYQTQRIYYNAATDETVVLYGQYEYSSLALAEAAIATEDVFIPHQLVYFSLRSYLIVQQGTTDLTSAVSGGTAKFIPTTKYGGAGGAVGGVTLEYTKDNANGAELYYGANVKLNTALSGINVFGTAFAKISLIDGDGEIAELNKAKGGTGDFTIQNKEHGGEFYLKAEGATGTIATLLRGNADAETSLYYDGNATLQTTANGADITTSIAAGDGIFGIIDGDTQVAEFTKEAAGALNIVNREHGQNVKLSAEDAGGTERLLFQGDPDAEASLYFDGGATLKTTANGIDVTTTVENGAGILSITEDSGEYTELWVSNTNKKFYIQNRNHGAGFAFRGERTDGTIRAYWSGEDDGRCYFNYDGNARFVTESFGARIESEGDTSLDFHDGDAQTASITKLSASGDLTIKNSEHGANMNFVCEDNLGVAQTMMTLNPDAGVYMYWDGGAQVFRTVPTGIQINGTTADAKIQMYDLNADSAEISKENSGDFVLTNLEKSGHIRLVARKADLGGYVTGLDFDPDAGVSLNYNNNAQLTTIDGGVQVESLLTLADNTQATIASGAITVTQSFHHVYTEGGASTDNLDNINGGENGALLIIRPSSSSRTVIARDGIGNLTLAGDFVMDNAADILTLIKTASGWQEISRSNNGA